MLHGCVSTRKGQKRRSIGNEEDAEQQSTEYLSGRYRPYYLQPQGWRDSVGETVEGPALRRWPIPRNFYVGSPIGVSMSLALV